MSGFAEVLAGMDSAAREASVRPAGGRDGAGPGEDPGPPPERAADGQALPAWVAGLSPEAQGVLARKLQAARTGYDPLQVEQADIDQMSDGEKWRYAEQVVAREQQLASQRRRDAQSAAAGEAQVQMEGHHDRTA